MTADCRPCLTQSDCVLTARLFLYDARSKQVSYRMQHIAGNGSLPVGRRSVIKQEKRMRISKQNPQSIKLRLIELLALVALLVGLFAACGATSWFENLDWGQCDGYAQEYTAAFESHGALMP